MELEEAFQEVTGWLDVKMATGRYSRGFVGELMVHLVARMYNVHAIYDEIAKLEGTDPRPSVTKAATQFTRKPLIGLWHKHHFQARFLVKNLMNELKSADGGKAFDAALASLAERDVEDMAGLIARQAVVGGFERRAGAHAMTGEFIVYERLVDGSNYYLTLGSHGEYEQIRNRVGAHRQFDDQRGHLDTR